MKKQSFLGVLTVGVVALLVSSSSEGAGPFQFYSITPCRLVDTRGPVGPTGGPILAGNVVRSFPIVGGTCGIPATAKAAVLNVVIVQSDERRQPAGLAVQHDDAAGGDDQLRPE